MSSDENQLRDQTSPYLLQHADNPVHWRPWGAAALAEARARNVPLLVSIGYAACHWCHVMAHESFEDSRTADFMNVHFVNVKIDREERPDIDHIYMSALHAMGEQGGWPLTMFATPSGEPFWGGTYFPPSPRYGRPSFRQVLEAIDEAWRERGDAVRKNAGAIRSHLMAVSAPSRGEGPGAKDFEVIANAYLRMNDPVRGGLSGAPKFPNCPIYRFLWSEAFRADNAAAAAAVRGLLDALCQGGIYDHVGGGFSRYSVDGEWRVPHFEKMLYDNAQILELLAFAHARSPSPLYAARADETVAWLLREMSVETPHGRAFAAAQDADQGGEEGAFYVWRMDEIVAALGEDAPLFARVYDIRPEGNWPEEAGKAVNVLRRVEPVGDAGFEARLRAMRETLFALRERRERPALDDKILADWNGLTVAALAKAACVFGRPEWLARAREAFVAVEATLRDGSGALAHAWRGRISAIGQLDDGAAMIRAALALFEAGGERAFLERAKGLARAVEADFGSPDGGFWLTSATADDVPALRPRHARDDAAPAGAGVMAQNLARLWLLTGENGWRERAARVAGAFSGDRERLSMSPSLLTGADMLARGRLVVVAGQEMDGETNAAAGSMLNLARAAPDPAVAVLWTRDGADWPEGSPAFGRAPAGGAPTAWICENQTCGLPLTSASDLSAQLQSQAATA